MPPDLHQRFEKLLLSLSQWERADNRHALLKGILVDHDIWFDLQFDGNARTPADHLLGLFKQYGPEPYLLLLAGLRAEHSHRAPEIDTLVADLKSLRRRRQPWSDGPPYRGLAYFDREHAPLFFGRDAEVEALIRTLTLAESGPRFTVVMGASGSGKSSLVRAGLWARLAAGEVPEFPGSERWLVTAMTPTELDSPSPDAALKVALLASIRNRDGIDTKRIKPAIDGPLADLADLLLPPGGNVRWLLILDQMEELFAPDRQAEGAAFLDRLFAGLSPGRPSRLQIVATLRADFFHHCLDHSALGNAIGRPGGQFNLRAPARPALERMVSGPLAELQLPHPWTLDPALPPAMAADAGERQAGGLALMAFALRELYDRCEPRRRLDLATYESESFGRLGGAIKRRADATLADLGQGGEAALARVFLLLVQVNLDDAPTRRRSHRSAWQDDLAALALIDTFIGARLLVADQDVIEVAHEALLREWPKLAAWIEQRREAFWLADRVRTEARAWKEGDPDRPWAASVIEEIRKKLPGDMLARLCGESSQVKSLLTPEVDWIIAELQRPGTTPFRRRDIGQRLNEIGDPRPGVGVLASGVPDVLWRAIPGGPVEPFRMAAYPVTGRQFRAFLREEDGYRNQRWWKDLKQEDPDSAWEGCLGNHPVTDVSWYDATAFCRWLSAQLRFEVRLPDEQEWEWAARSAHVEFEYPWGEDWLANRANTSESDINRTTAAGMFALGDNLQAVSDLSGNVWEWCLNEYKRSERTQPGGEESRVVCGGSWLDGQDGARAGCRYGFGRGNRGSGIGFRVVCSSPVAER